MITEWYEVSSRKVLIRKLKEEFEEDWEDIYNTRIEAETLHELENMLIDNFLEIHNINDELLDFLDYDRIINAYLIESRVYHLKKEDIYIWLSEF